jgi:hypothetical protein
MNAEGDDVLEGVEEVAKKEKGAKYLPEEKRRRSSPVTERSR